VVSDSNGDTPLKTVVLLIYGKCSTLSSVIVAIGISEIFVVRFAVYSNPRNLSPQQALFRN
jgi:hypothetical protein